MEIQTDAKLNDERKNDIEELMTIIDENYDKINEGIYLQTCNLMKRIYESNRNFFHDNGSLSKEKEALKRERDLLKQTLELRIKEDKVKEEGDQLNNDYLNTVNGLSYSNINFSWSLLDN
jgi:hypothetical protein